ncbi:MAG: hypothetical protein C6P37_01995 [Caldibacillus debilis]|uniref:Uncharacterized protein n=1 Tax=Caldibacillus debilis TaxID=301148 RepID=A0A3E0K7U1_9BACI|nr:MAG: hypothetical protein BAA03_01040 [Caldibacillus debilis]REJ31131.1 MAG: hypothetical protein C6P37_01995 [Caldibacillus debilis]
MNPFEFLNPIGGRGRFPARSETAPKGLTGVWPPAKGHVPSAKTAKGNDGNPAAGDLLAGVFVKTIDLGMEGLGLPAIPFFCGNCSSIRKGMDFHGEGLINAGI